MAKEDVTPTKALQQLRETSLIYATCGMICAHGVVKYWEDDDSRESAEIRYRDGTMADELLNRLLFANAVDNFNTYLGSLLYEILAVDPRPMYGKKVDFKTIYNTSDIDDLRAEALERYVIELGYQSISDLADALEKSFGLSTLKHWLTKKRLNRLVQMRNIIAHNGGMVNRTYLLRSGDKRQKPGELIRVGFALTTAKYLSRLARRIDVEATAKFPLVKQVHEN